MVTEIKKRLGRPTSFDRETALKEALKLFWDRGFEGTSFDELVAAMRISPSSFYNSFGSKEALYRETVGEYLASSGVWFMGEMNSDTDTRTAFRNVLERAAREFTRAEGPSGCMISLAATHVPPSLGSIRAMMTECRRGAENAMAERIRRGIEAGDLSAATNVEALAAFYSVVSRGMAVQARDGTSTERLLEIVDVSMNAWPT